MSEYGIKIKNISAAMLYEVNLGIKDYFTYTHAMLNNSLFSFYMQKNGLNIHKDESTKDIICLDFDFGSPSYEEEKKRLEKLLNNMNTEEASKERIIKTLEKIECKKHLFCAKKRHEIREEFYQNGVNVTYKTRKKDDFVCEKETIHYEMLFRTSAKAKLGQVVFINGKLYKKAYDWLTIGLGNKISNKHAKIVEMSAYAPLTTSTIIGTIFIPVEDVLIVNDQDSFFKTIANIVKSQTYKDNNNIAQKKCIVVQEETQVKNTLWDGMGLIESSLLPSWVNGMALLRNHLFKMCGFRTHLQNFFKDWCEKKGHNYETYRVRDMFGKWHYVKDIKMITTNNSIKWNKFAELMGDTLVSSYEYWCARIRADHNTWGIVKTEHISKLGQYQQISYQMCFVL